jgi:nucleotide-binding universal stress UspA family protein
VSIVVGYDPSPGSQAAFTAAIDLAQRYGETLVVVYGYAAPGGLGEEARAHEAAIAELGRRSAAPAVERATAVGVDAELELVPQKPAAALVHVAEARGARMIVVGSRGESLLRGALLGSTTYKVLGMATCPVLVVPALNSTP